MTDKEFNDRKSLIKWVRDIGFEHHMFFAIQSSIKGTGLGHGRVRIGCERSGSYRRHLPSGKNVKSRKGTSTKKNKCPFELLGVELLGGHWKLKVDFNKSRHNHEIGIYNQWHTSAAKLSKEEFCKVAQLRLSNMRPKQILKQLKLDNKHNVSNIRHVDNALQKNKRELMGDLTPVQYFFKQLKDRGYYYDHRREVGTNALGDVFFAHPKATDMLRLFPYVLIMDTTYRTNRYDLPLLEIIGVSPTGHNFHVGFAFIKNEVNESFLWALRRVKELFHDNCYPGVVVTDREQALIKAVQLVFPSSAHMLCKRHIAKDVEKYVTNLTGDKSISKAFSSRWKKIVNSLTEEEYNDAVEKMVKSWSPKLVAIVEYVQKTWLVPYKDTFVSVWTKHNLHFGVRTTNRVESGHSQLKSWLGTATGAFHVIFPKIHDLIEMQLDEIKGEMEKSRSKSLDITRFQLFSRLKCKVSHQALKLLKEEFETRGKIVGNNVDLCGCEMRTCYGLPCAHEMGEMVINLTPIDLTDIHIFWKTLDLEVLDIPENSSTRQSASEWLDELVATMKQFPKERQYFFGTTMYNLIYPEATTLQEPIPRPHKGRRKHNPTQRDKSGWEYAEKNAKKGKKKKGNSNKVLKESISNEEKGKKKEDSKSLIEQPMSKKFKSAEEVSVIHTNFELSSGSKYRFPFENELDSFILPYIIGHENVASDGNCGFRTIAFFVYDDENRWKDVRNDLIQELASYKDMYVNAMGKCVDEYDKAWKILHWFELDAPRAFWFEVMSLGLVVATKYQRVFTYWCKDTYCTFLPLECRTGGEPPRRYINMARLWKIHFIALHMSNGFPMPPIFNLWSWCCHPTIKHWPNEVYGKQLDLYKTLRPTIREHVTLDI